MKKRVLLVLGLYLCSMTVLGFAKDQSWDGWVSDSKCGAKGANAAHELFPSIIPLLCRTTWDITCRSRAA